MRLTLEHRRWLWAYAFMLIPVVFFLAIRIGPTFYAFWMSLHKWDPIAITHPYVGLDNFRKLQHDDVFWKSMRNTWTYVLIGVPVSMALSLIIALGLQRLARYVGFYRVLYFAPYVTSLVAVGWVWRWDPYPFILLNLVLNVIASYTAPLIMMAQNRDAERDRLMMHEDFETNRHVADEVYKILRVLGEHGQMLTTLLEQRNRRDRTRL